MQPNDRSKTERRSKRNSSVDLSSLMYGKVPPQAIELEEAVLGALMLEKNAYDIASSILSAECFYVDAHQKIFSAIQNMKGRSMPVDLLTVVEELKCRQELDIIGGPSYLMKLNSAVVSSAHISAHAMIIHQKFMQREIIRISGEMISAAYESSTDPFDLLDESEHKLSSLAVSKTTKPYRHILEIAREALDGIEALRHTEETITGVPSGIHDLDTITQGWQPTSLIVIAARPAVGKSAVAGNLAVNAAINKIKPTGVGIFSLEMAAIQWVVRMLSAETMIEKYALKRGRVNDEDMENLRAVVATRFAQARIFFDDSSSLDIYQFKNKARQMVLKDKVGLIIIDYLQLMGGNRSNNENREQEVSRISRELKQLAKELNIPIIALSQLSRKGEGTEPTLSTLRESGAIEQDADEVYFLIPVNESESPGNPETQDGLIINIAKHRDSVTDKIYLRFVKPYQKIMNENEYQAYMHPSQVQKTISDMSGGKFYVQKGLGGNFDDGVPPAARY